MSLSKSAYIQKFLIALTRLKLLYLSLNIIVWKICPGRSTLHYRTHTYIYNFIFPRFKIIAFNIQQRFLLAFHSYCLVTTTAFNLSFLFLNCSNFFCIFTFFSMYFLAYTHMHTHADIAKSIKFCTVSDPWIRIRLQTIIVNIADVRNNFSCNSRLYKLIIFLCSPSFL